MESKEVKPERRKKGLWKPEEDLILKKYVETHGEGNWATVSEKSGLSRGGKSCRLRWKNYLRPNIKHGGMSEEEEDLIIRMHKLLGNRWSLIAGRLPGRTDNEVKNYWNTHLNKNCLGCKRKTMETNNRQNDNDNESQTKKKLCQSHKSETTSNASRINSIEVPGRRKEEEISTITNPWIENAKSFKCEIESLLTTTNSAAFFFDNELSLPTFDSLLMFEALGCMGDETYSSQYYMNSTFQ